MQKVAKTGFCWTDDEIQLLLESMNQYKCKFDYKVINWQRIRVHKVSFRFFDKLKYEI